MKDKKNPDQIALIWCTQDILDQADVLRVKLNKTQAREILHQVDHRHDASIGVNWDVISEAIRSYKE